MNPQTHSTQQNKKAVLTKAAYFKVSTLQGFWDNNHALFTFVYQKSVSGIKHKKWTAQLNSAYSN